MNNSNFKTNVFIIGGVFLIIFVFAFIFKWVGAFLELVFFKPGFSSILILIIFTFIALWKRLSWKNYGVILVCAISVAGLSFDYIGNTVYNYPISLFTTHNGETLKIIQHVSSYGGTTSINYSVAIVNTLGETLREINGFLFAFYRFTQYIILYSMLLSIIGIWSNKHPFAKKERVHNYEPFLGDTHVIDNHLNRSSKNIHELKMSEIERRTLLSILMSENTIEAIKYLRSHEGMSLSDSKKWVENWMRDINN